MNTDSTHSKFLEKLLLSEEDFDLEFKQILDLDTSEGKGKFLKEMLALANSCQEESYLVVGIEDKTKKVVGTPSLSEEQLQQVVSDNCRPPIDFSMKNEDYKGLNVALITIVPSDIRPHTLKKPLNSLSDKQVFVRHGSVSDIATPDEVVLLAQSRSDIVQMNAAVVSQLRRVEQQLEEIADSSHSISRSLRWGWKEDESNRLIEGIFIGMVSGAVIGWLLSLGFEFSIEGAPIIAFMISVLASTLKLVKFGFLRALVTSVIIGIPLSIVFSQLLDFVLSISDSEIVVYFVLCAMLGTISGVIGSLIVSYFESRTG